MNYLGAEGGQVTFVKPEGCTAPPPTKIRYDHLMENLIISNLKRLMPRGEIPVCNGDPCEYPSFIKAFHRVISNKITNDDQKLTYLELYTSGLAKKMVSGCQYLPTEEGHKTTFISLEERFGREDMAARESLNKVTN